MSSKYSKDELYALPLNELVDFCFDEKTVSVFPDMINRSVPGYSLIQSLTGLIAKRFVQPNTTVYDLGCSLGASSLSILNSVEHGEYELVMVDQSEQMLGSCQSALSEFEKVSLKFLLADITELEVSNASMVVLNLVLQFVEPKLRYELLAQIYHGLNVGGALLITEKVAACEDAFETELEELYIDFKRRSGYSDLEIMQKRQALENVMIIESKQAHVERLQSIGFAKVLPVMQALNFVSFLAVK